MPKKANRKIIVNFDALFTHYQSLNTEDNIDFVGPAYGEYVRALREYMLALEEFETRSVDSDNKADLLQLYEAMNKKSQEVVTGNPDIRAAKEVMDDSLSALNDVMTSMDPEKDPKSVAEMLEEVEAAEKSREKEEEERLSDARSEADPDEAEEEGDGEEPARHQGGGGALPV